MVGLHDANKRFKRWMYGKLSICSPFLLYSGPSYVQASFRSPYVYFIFLSASLSPTTKLYIHSLNFTNDFMELAYRINLTPTHLCSSNSRVPSWRLENTVVGKFIYEYLGRLRWCESWIANNEEYSLSIAISTGLHALL